MSRINSILLGIACIVLVLTVFVAVINMILRPFGHPVTGSFEVMGYGSAVVTALGLGFSQEKKSHISVDILFRHFPYRVRIWLSAIGLGICALFFGAVSVRLFQFALDLKANGELSETLMIPFYPVVMIVAFGVMILTVNLAHDALSVLFGRRKKAGS